MQKKSSLQDIEENFGVIIGNFDGVHIGHQAILKTFKKECQKIGLKACVLTYKPHPGFVLEKVSENFLIQSYEEKIKTLSEIGLDYLVELKFTEKFSHLSGKDFFNQSFSCCPNLKKIFPGYDFSFGANRDFGLDDLKEECEKSQIAIHVLEKIEASGERVSSTLIRQKLKKGEIQNVNSLLGREYSVTSTVVHGFKNGRKMNFPTVNISLKQERVLPKIGVYKTLLNFKDKSYRSLTNIGYRPTFDGKDISVETFIIDFSEEIYEETIEVIFLDFIRDEKKFTSFEELKEQISKDLKYAWG